MSDYFNKNPFVRIALAAQEAEPYYIDNGNELDEFGFYRYPVNKK